MKSYFRQDRGHLLDCNFCEKRQMNAPMLANHAHKMLIVGKVNRVEPLMPRHPKVMRAKLLEFGHWHRDRAMVATADLEPCQKLHSLDP